MIPVYKHRDAIIRYHELTPWAVSEKKWDTNEDKGKSMMYCSMPKGT